MTCRWFSFENLPPTPFIIIWSSTPKTINKAIICWLGGLFLWIEEHKCLTTVYLSTEKQVYKVKPYVRWRQRIFNKELVQAILNHTNHSLVNLVINIATSYITSSSDARSALIACARLSLWVSRIITSVCKEFTASTLLKDLCGWGALCFLKSVIIKIALIRAIQLKKQRCEWVFKLD